MSYGKVLGAFFGVVACAVLQSKFAWRRRTKGTSLPPSRPGWPLIGNVLDLVAVLGEEWEAYKAWGKELASDIFVVRAAGQYIVVLNTQEMAEELLDKASATFSSRPRSEMVHLMGYGDWALPLLPYGTAWREQRRVFHQFFPPGDSTLPAERLPYFLHHFLASVYRPGEDVQKHTKELVAGLMFSLAYGIDITKERQYLELGEAAVAPLVEVTVPGRFMVDLFPWLKYVPAWMPGAGFQRDAVTWKALQERFRTVPFRDALERREYTSLVSMAVSDSSEAGEEPGYRVAVQDTASMFFAAGTETTVAALDFFLLALIHHPEAQRKAQQELDAAFPQLEVLPTFDAVAELPYLNALINEVLRWQSVAPIGVPHVSTEDHIYRGYFIPKGSIVIANAWAMSRNEKQFHEPEAFKPERFLHADGSFDESVPDLREFVFGFGRRICPGKHIALSTLLTTTAAILLLFDTSKQDGEEVTLPVQAKTGIARAPKPFKCSLIVRSAAAKAFLEGLRSDSESDVQ